MAPKLRRGISVLLASYRGVDRIEKALTSLAQQTLDKSLFEVICCLNGPDDGTEQLIRTFQELHADLSIVVLRSEKSGLALARNMGLKAASFTFFTNVDDDDWVSPEFLQGLLRHCSMKTIAMTYVCNVSDTPSQPSERFGNYLSRGILPYAGRTVSPHRVPAGSADGGKAAPTVMGQAVLYDEDLNSGLDVVFWSSVVTRFGLRAHVLKIKEHAIYYRLVRTGSMSRRVDERFIEERFQVIARLRALAKEHPLHAAWVTQMMGGQVGLLGRTVMERPDWHDGLYDRLKAHINRRQLRVFNHNAARTLAICYIYTPYNDASAIVATKRLALAGVPFDVITHDMGSLRDEDPSTAVIDARLRGYLITLTGAPSSASSNGLADFCVRGALAWNNLVENRAPYDNLYSRAQWTFSHGLAALIKTRQPEIRWTAEFSDPISVALDGTERPGPLHDFPERKEVDRAVRATGVDIGSCSTVHEWVEWVSYALADEILFTNENQMEFMLSRVKDPALVARVRKHAKVSQHPPVPSYVLAALPVVPKPEDSRIHVGYFGRYYKKRAIDDVMVSLSKLPQSDRDRIQLHMFVPSFQLHEVRHYAHQYHLGDCVRVKPSMDYMDFLATARALDWVVVVDSQVGDLHGINPYLPSKYADYVSVGAKVWGIIEPGSPLSNRPLDAQSTLGNAEEADEVLKSIIEGHVSRQG